MAGIAHGMKPKDGSASASAGRGKGPSKAVAKEFNKADAKTGILRKK